MKTIGSFIVRRRILVAVILLAVTGVLGWRATLLEENLSFETLYLSNDPNIEFSEAFADKFENVNDMVAVALTGGELFTPEFLGALDRMTTRLEKLREVDVVYSLANIRYIQGTEDGLDVTGFIEDVPDNPEDAAEVGKNALAYELFRGRLVSEDGKWTAIVVQTEDVVGRSADPYVAELFSQLGSADHDVRDSAAGNVERMRERILEVVPADSEAASLISGLDGASDALREAAIGRLAEIGPDAITKLTLEDRRKLVATIEGIVAEELPAGYRQYVTGNNVIERDYAKILRWDKAVFHVLTVLVLLVAFYFSFRSIRDTAIAFMALLLAALCALGTIELIGGVIDIINSVVFVMVLVVGTSDVIHMTHDFYRHWQPEDGPRTGAEAAIRMVARVGFACLITSLTTAVGFFSLYFARIGTVSHFGLNMAAAIVVTYAVSLTAVTIMFSFVRSLPRRREEGRAKESWLDRRLLRLSAFVVERRGVAVLVCVCVFCVLASGFTRLYVETHTVAEVAESSPTKLSMRAMENLSGFIGFEVSVQAKGDRKVIDPDVLSKIDQIAAYLKDQPETLRTWCVTDYMRSMNRAANDGDETFYAVPDSDAAADQFLLLYTFSKEGRKEMDGLISHDRTWVRIVSRVYDVGAGPYLALRDRVEDLGRELFPEGDFEVRVTSEMFLLHTAMDGIVRDLARSIGYAFVLVAILMGLSLKSVRLGLLAILPNVIPVLATLGFMGLVGIPLRVGTIVVFSLGFGIAVDDTIHYLLRYRIERGRASSYAEAIRRSHIAVGKPMVMTSLVLMAGFLAMTPATFKSISHMGILNAFTMAAALLADLLVTPLLLRLGEGSGVETNADNERRDVPHPEVPEKSEPQEVKTCND
ncbi:RND family transporter [Planctomycetota bacterium]